MKDDVLNIKSSECQIELRRKDDQNDKGKYTVDENHIYIDCNLFHNFKNILYPLLLCRSELISKSPNFDVDSASERISFPDRFRDYCISLILSNYKGGIRGRDVLIKGLKKYYSPSEMYKYLVDQLWENDATEKLIRQTIQEEMRSDVTVMCYYKELLKLLTDSLVIDETQKTVYDGIFRKACEAFVVKKKK